MHRLVILVVGTLAACFSLAGVTGLPAANAATPLTGRLVDSTSAANPGVPNMTVRLVTVTSGGGAGVVVDTDVTGPNGFFALDAGPSPDPQYFVQVLPGNFQGGWVGGSGTSGMDWVQPTFGDADTYGPHDGIGSVQALPAFVRGTVIDQGTGIPVQGVTVRMTEGSDLTIVYGSDVTNANGVFRIGGLSGEDNFGLRVNGSAQGYEVGWFNGFSHEVVPTWGEATAAPLGKAGKVKIEP